MSLTLSWNNEQEQYEITHALIEKLEELLRLAGTLEQVTDGEVALTFTDDAAIQELNKQYRGLDKPTDVLSFSMQEMGDEEMEIIYGDEDDAFEDDPAKNRGDEDEGFEEPLGDIIISVPRAVEQAADYGHSIDREIGFLFVHGFLHLIGYDHQDEEEERVMFGKQEQILQQAGLTR
ncbi:rRNA maturation RNase YbeY [Paenibacillus naphthalenovorans]|uniref:Endoribonuclease YbeY n=1 Tax=Paenibacillus naphthalenovorans TaxID=162209 RepID=A0A0U2UHE7_9BACL|nr:rRNA maturation RNase YbeY [Paenibacillus naphthalenovorans]ALS21313.1 16S rRNA maturation RNase YbeY [Paenibacillus naphthalenovorans]GCL72569.1 rRNA maturation RNase YbeY [Paenibacillus naphthalenovorans]